MPGTLPFSVRVFALSAGLLSAVQPGVFARQPAAASTRSSLKAAYAKLAQAIRNKDADAYDQSRASDFTVTMPDGTHQSGKEVSSHMRQAMAQASGAPFIQFTIEKLNRSGQEVTATVRQQHRGTLRMKGGQLARVQGWLRSRDTWVRTANGWKMKRMVVLKSQTNLNGKPMSPRSVRGLRVKPQPRNL